MMSILKFSNEVKEAIAAGKPLVALESTIIAHGMPWPSNVATAREVENIIRQEGAVPATIAIIQGEACIGLNDNQLELLGSEKDVWKVSLRDMPFVIAQKKNGATTVAATMHLASLAGIKIFVTGGIGGVHRGAEKSMDISADLEAMTNINVAVVSAGVKSILDIGLTLEVLETSGVPVLTYGSEEFPSFYSRRSGHPSPLTLNTPGEIAEMLNTKWRMQLPGSVLIANPVPESQDFPFEKMESHILSALSIAEKQKVKGKDITPFLLKYIADKTAGESLASNIALIKNNAALGAKIATCLNQDFQDM